MPNGRIETQDQWLASHKAKFDRAGLSKAERLRRYRDYASSSAAKAETLNPRSAVARTPRAKLEPAPFDERLELFRAMNDPFGACSQDGHLPRVPDGTLRETGVFKFNFNVDIYSDSNGRAFFFFDTSPFRCFVASQTTSNVVVTDVDYVAQCEYNAFAAAAGRAGITGAMPPWTADSWSIPVVLTGNEGTTDPTIGFQPANGYTALWDLAQAWRPVCGGVKFTNTSKVLNRQGTVVVARWPGALGAPVVSNNLLVVNAGTTRGATFSAYEGQGPNFNTVQSLPSKEVLSVSEGFKATWAPESTESQAAWRPIHPKPMGAADSDEGLLQYSDFEATGVLILPDPCNGDPNRYCALIDRVMTQNANARNNSPALDPVTYGADKGLYFQSYGATADANDTATSFAMRDVVKGFNQASMLVDNTGLVMVFEGCDPDTLLGTVQVCLGVEYIADSSLVTTGNGPSVDRVRMSKSKQLDVHHATIAALQEAPAVVEKGLGFVESVVGSLPRVANVVSQAAPYVEMALAALAAL